ncbi:MAG: proline dehydrogenase family protein [Deltaproteobacteria bacterium]
MLRAILLYLSEREFPKKLLTGHSIGRRLARRFIAGDSLEEAVRAVRAINAEGFDTTLDCLGESVHDAAAAAEACEVYLGILDRLAAEGLRSHVSIKLTQLGMAIDEQLALKHLRALCERAKQHHNFIRIDMESSAYTETTMRIFRTVNEPRDVLGMVIQSYLRRSERDVEELNQCGARVRLVKGAYQEPPDLAFPNKKDVDANFVKLTEMLLASGQYHAIATHDDRMIQATKGIAAARSLGKDKFEFQMLYGIRRQLQRDLLQQGFRVRVYVPYGKQWYAYFMRRLAERPANLLFLIKNFFRG